MLKLVLLVLTVTLAMPTWLSYMSGVPEMLMNSAFLVSLLRHRWINSLFKDFRRRSDANTTAKSVLGIK